MKYVVTGGAGFIGSHIVEELERRGHDVAIVDTYTGDDILDITTLKDAFDGADGVFHEAAVASVPVSVKMPRYANEVNTTGTLNVLDVARAYDVKKVVFASSAAVYGNNPAPNREDQPTDPLSPYAVSKVAGENYMNVYSDLYGLDTVSLRYFNVFGPRQTNAVIPLFIRQITNRQPITIYGDGWQTRDFTFVNDVVQANIRAMESSARGVFNVATGQQTNLFNLAGTIMEIAGIDVLVNHAPARAGEVRDSVADISKARETFGYVPEYTVRSGLMEML
jgi:UDP-glucose 4-epimerase